MCGEPPFAQLADNVERRTGSGRPKERDAVLSVRCDSAACKATTDSSSSFGRGRAAVYVVGHSSQRETIAAIPRSIDSQRELPDRVTNVSRAVTIV